ncbi:MAG: hypothetical protein J6U47_03455 [Bacteroidales bacterium]|nr:hypothetical protein [Bacteroidales bacterium]
MRKLFVLIVALCVTSFLHAQEGIDTTAVAQDTVAVVNQVTDASMAPAENPYKTILLERTFTFSLSSLFRGLLGMAVILAIAWIFSLDRKRINWGTVLKALGLQLLIAVSVLVFPGVQKGFELFGQGFVAVLDWTKAGSNFLFGSFMDVSKFGFVFVFQILPTIIFFSALTS